MLDKALLLMTDRLNAYFDKAFDLDEKIAQLGSPTSPDGVMPVEASDKILVYITNINKETLPNGQAMQSCSSNITQKPLYLNLFVSVSANFRSARYKEALNFLSHAIACFHQTPVIDSSNHADMPTGISKLVIDIENTDLHQESNLWGIFGGKYLPSILYKVRMLCITDDTVIGQASSVSAPDYGVGA